MNVINNSDNSCSELPTIPQFSGTCWFNALMMALLYSQGMKTLVQASAARWRLSEPSKRVLQQILEQSTTGRVDRKRAYEFFRQVTPESIMAALHAENPRAFDYNPGLQPQGHVNTLYLPRLLEHLGVSALHLDAVLDGDDDVGAGSSLSLYFSNVYNDYVIERAQGTHAARYRRVTVDRRRLPKAFDVITVRFVDDELHDPGNLYMQNVPVADVIGSEVLRFPGAGSFKHDSLVLANFNVRSCGSAHDICGVTCGGQRYIYNVWMRQRGDGNSNKYPCQLMKHDWLRDSKNFCLNSADCRLEADVGKAKLCYNINRGTRTYILVRQQQQAVAAATGGAKIRNPATGRLVNAEGRVGRKIREDGKMKKKR